MSTLTLFHCHESRSMRVLWLLHELDVEFELKVIPFESIHHNDYLQVHPLGRVPAITLDGEVMFESLAICQYLTEQLSPTRLNRPAGHHERAALLQWLHYSETITTHCVNLVQQFLIIQPETLRSETVVKLERRRLEKAITILTPLLTAQEFLLSSGFSLADITLGYSLHFASKFVDLSKWPEVCRYYQRLAARPAFEKSLPTKEAPYQIFNRQFY